MHEIIVITGASSGIGKALAIELVARGKKILAVARSLDALQQLKQMNPDLIDILNADVANPEDRKQIAHYFQPGKKISALINNAALAAPSGYLEDLDLEKWRYQITVNLEAPLFLTNQLLPFLHQGRVLNITIYSSYHVSVGLAAYGISKAGLNMLTQYQRTELKKYDIDVTNVLPGLVATNMQKQLPTSPDIPIVARAQKLREEGKLLQPETVAKFLSWLLLDTSGETFAEKTWDIYDETHHSHWAKGLKIIKPN